MAQWYIKNLMLYNMENLIYQERFAFIYETTLISGDNPNFDFW